MKTPAPLVPACPDCASALAAEDLRARLAMGNLEPYEARETRCLEHRAADEGDDRIDEIDRLEAMADYEANQDW